MLLENIKPYLYWSGLFLFLLLEMRRSFRQPSVSKLNRWLTNLPLSVVNGVLYHLVYSAAITTLLLTVQEQKLGLLTSVALPYWLQIVLGICILDFFIYIWHLLNHEVPLFWRFHRVHHSDMNMDASTANRFHLGEFMLSGLVRLGVVYSFGIPLLAYLLFEILVNLSIQFHHSSIRISPRFENLWILLFVPPSMHRLHHSVKIKERDSNYGVLLSLWDRFLGTFTWGVDQETITIGIGSHRKFNQLGFWHLMKMPFTKQSL
jgi:sterol desaturase/sphingolipid hydroxylase (fatty acid hydroxylase superfamily)